MSDRHIRELERRLSREATPESRWALVHAMVRYRGVTYTQAHREVVGIGPSDVIGLVAVRSHYLHIASPATQLRRALCTSKAKMSDPVFVSEIDWRQVLRARRAISLTAGVILDGNPVWYPCSVCWTESANFGFGHPGGCRKGLASVQRNCIGLLSWGCLMDEHAALDIGQHPPECRDCRRVKVGEVWRPTLRSQAADEHRQQVLAELALDG